MALGVSYVTGARYCIALGARTADGNCTGSDGRCTGVDDLLAPVTGARLARAFGRVENILNFISGIGSRP